MDWGLGIRVFGLISVYGFWIEGVECEVGASVQGVGFGF